MIAEIKIDSLLWTEKDDISLIVWTNNKIQEGGSCISMPYCQQGEDTSLCTPRHQENPFSYILSD